MSSFICPGKLLNMRRALMGTLIHSRSVRSTGKMTWGWWLVSTVGADLWCWALNLWYLTQSPGRWCRNWVKLWDTQLVSARGLLGVWEKPTHAWCQKWNIEGVEWEYSRRKKCFFFLYRQVINTINVDPSNLLTTAC